MLKQLKLGMLVIISTAFLLLPAAPAMAAFDPFAKSCTNTNTSHNVPSSAVCVDKKKNSTNPISGPDGIINTAANIIAVVGGVAAVIVIIVSGIRFVTSGDNPDTAKAARSGIALALAGLVVIALAWAIVTFISDRILP